MITNCSYTNIALRYFILFFLIHKLFCSPRSEHFTSYKLFAKKSLSFLQKACILLLFCRHVGAMVRGAITCIDHNFNVNRPQVTIFTVVYSDLQCKLEKLFFKTILLSLHYD